MRLHLSKDNQKNSSFEVNDLVVDLERQVLPGLHLSKDNQKNLSFEVKDLVLYLGQVHLSKYNVKKSSFEVNDLVLDMEGRRTTRTVPPRMTCAGLGRMSPSRTLSFEDKDKDSSFKVSHGPFEGE